MSHNQSGSHQVGHPAKVDDAALQQLMQKIPGLTAEQMAGYFNCTTQTIQRHLKDMGHGQPQQQGDVSVHHADGRTKITNAELKQYLQQNPSVSQDDIAQAFDCTVATVQRHLKEIGVDTSGNHGGGRAKIENEDLKAYLKQNPNVTQEDLAGHFDCTVGTVQRHLKEIGVDTGNSGNQGGGGQYNQKIVNEELQQYLQQNPKASQEDIAQQFSCTIPTVQRHLKEIGIDVADHSFDIGQYNQKIDNGDLQNYLKQTPNATQEDIAQNFSCTVQTVQRHLKEIGIDTSA